MYNPSVPAAFYAVCCDKQVNKAGHGTDQIPVTQLVQPEVVDGCGGHGEVIGFHPLVARVHSVGEATQDPPVQLRFLA